MSEYRVRSIASHASQRDKEVERVLNEGFEAGYELASMEQYTIMRGEYVKLFGWLIIMRRKEDILLVDDPSISWRPVVYNG